MAPQDRIIQRKKPLAMLLIGIGKLRDSPERALFERYNTRLRPRLGVVELAEQRGSPPEIKRKEATTLLAALPRDAFVVPLDLGGPTLTSEAFADRLDRWSARSRTICFLIGGAEGLDASVIDRADHVLSLGGMTWPHFLVRGMLAEQLYRAQTILLGHPYHKPARPGI